MVTKSRSNSENFRQSTVTTIISTLKSFVSTVRSFLFAFYYPKFLELFYNDGVRPFKREVFAGMDSVIPADRLDGGIRILEIGVGPGKMKMKLKIKNV